MKRITPCVVFILILLFPSIYLSAQTPDSSGIYSIASVMPAYQGGDEALFNFIHENVKYPKEALEQKKAGTVQMRVVIDEQGSVSHVRVVRGICASLDEEAQRVISATSGKWIAGKVDDKPVKVYKYLKVSFKIDTSTSDPVAPVRPRSEVAFIGGDEAFFNFIRKHVQIPNAVILHPNLFGPVTVSATFNSLNQITDVVLLKGPFKDLNEEGVRLMKLSQGKWMRTDSSKMSIDVTAIITLPFNQTMIDTNDKNKIISENIILTACNTNPVFKRAYENYQARSYDVAMVDLDDCINKNENLDAALAVRAFCYLNTDNNAAACEDLLKLKMKPQMDSRVVEIYYKYCADSGSKIGNHPSGRWGNKTR